ncbi:MAG TPA: BamA/TamA family outer membrane protein [Myxococcales bacterium]|nr:BamA/TamA family outer membrane protein [Myxococcales bacterium]
MMRVPLVLLSACLLSLPAKGQVASTRSDCVGGLSTRPIPLPVYSTLPNEGNTFGVMPVFLRVCDATERTESIIAPSVTWNDVINLTGTIRWFHYPADDQALTVIASASTRINSNLLVLWRDLPLAPGALTQEIELRWLRSAFYRFFGLGPDTTAAAETSYTRVRAVASARTGLNLGGNWNAGVGLLLHRDAVQDLGVPGLPLSRRTFPGVPGMEGSTTLGQTIGVRYDSRPNAEYSDRGLFANAEVGVIEGLARSPAYLRGALRLRALQPETRWLYGAARFDTSVISTPNAPFYDQSTLGGAYLLRGFTEDRFIDQNAWTFEVEQRVQILQTHIFGVTADWRIDPFVAVGQVYRSLSHAFSEPRVTGGVGFRAWVRPNIVGRVDVATGGEGLKVYVEIGYPF